MKNLKQLTSAPPRPVISWDKYERIERNKEIWDRADSIVHRLPLHYQQRYWRNVVLADAQPVHYEPFQYRLGWDERRLVEVELEVCDPISPSFQTNAAFRIIQFAHYTFQRRMPVFGRAKAL